MNEVTWLAAAIAPGALMTKLIAAAAKSAEGDIYQRLTFAANATVEPRKPHWISPTAWF